MKIWISKRFSPSLRRLITAGINFTSIYKPITLREVRVYALPKTSENLGQAMVSKNRGIIYLGAHETVFQFMDTLIHETVHISQFSVNALEMRKNAFYWYGVKIPHKLYDKFHGEIPFEKEAIEFAGEACVALAQDLAKVNGVPTKKLLEIFGE